VASCSDSEFSLLSLDEIDLMSSSDLAAWVSAIATAIGSAVVGGGLIFTFLQLTDARKVQEANVIYNAQKDYHDLLLKTGDSDFQKCFGGPPSALPSACIQDKPRDTFLEILRYFQLLIDLQRLDAVNEQYVNATVTRFCPFYKTGHFTFEQFAQQKFVSDELAKRLSTLCGG
jgi:hypothetical protein